MKPLPLEVKQARQIERLQRANRDLYALNRKLSRRGGGYDSFIEEMRETIEQEGAFKFSSRAGIKQYDPFDPNHEEVVCIPSSDLHIAETVRAEESNGINIYNSIIASNRLWSHSQKIKSVVARHMAMYNIGYLWMPILGDMVSGSIHTDQVMNNDLSDEASVVLCTRLMQMHIEELKAVGRPIKIDCIVGNHPRTTVKMPLKRQAHTNLDWVVYEMLATMFKDDPQIEFVIHTGQIGIRKIYDWRYLIEHGIDVKNGQEENYEDRIRALFDDPTYRQATGLKGPSFDQIVIGNLHKAKFLERTIVNSSYVGQNELGVGWRLKPIRAQQLMWGVSKKQVRTWGYALDFTDIRSEKVDNSMSEYATWFLRRHGK